MNPKINGMRNKSYGQLYNCGLEGLLKRALEGDFVIPLVAEGGEVYVLIDHTIPIEKKDYDLYKVKGRALYNDIMIGGLSNAEH